MKHLVWIASSIFLFKGTNRIKNLIKDPPSAKQIGGQVLTFGVILGSVWMLSKTWFRRLPRVKRLFVMFCIGLLFFMMLFGLIPSIVVILKILTSALLLIITTLKWLSRFLGG